MTNEHARHPTTIELDRCRGEFTHKLRGLCLTVNACNWTLHCNLSESSRTARVLLAELGVPVNESASHAQCAALISQRG